uniref:protein-serine/threonine phosphatase n=1 Tax=Salix viminalis TaxID=40686 RepID=A0A6N2MRC0_SALVM
MKFQYAMVCSSNQNRSMEAHSLLKRHGFDVSSYGTGSHVKLPGPSLREPNVYDFGTPYKQMFDDLRRKDPELYKRNGILPMLKRNSGVKLAPQRWQDNAADGSFTVVLTFEEKVFDMVLEDLHNRDHVLLKSVLVINLEVKIIMRRQLLRQLNHGRIPLMRLSPHLRQSTGGSWCIAFPSIDDASPTLNAEASNAWILEMGIIGIVSKTRRASETIPSLQSPSTKILKKKFETLTRVSVTSEMGYCMHSGVKLAPQRWQDNAADGSFTVVLTFEEKVFDMVLEDLHNRDHVLLKSVLVINLEVKDNHEEAAVGGQLTLELCQKTMKFRYAMVCSSNQNRSMEAHSLLKRHGFDVSSYGTGSHVKLPGPSLREPNVYDFGTPYKQMFDDLRRKDPELCELAPQRWQDNAADGSFTVVLTFEEKVFDMVLEVESWEDSIDEIIAAFEAKHRRKLVYSISFY